MPAGLLSVIPSRRTSVVMARPAGATLVRFFAHAALAGFMAPALMFTLAAHFTMMFDVRDAVAADLVFASVVAGKSGAGEQSQ